MKFNSIQGSISKNAVKSIFLGLLLLFFAFIVGSYFFDFSAEGMKEGADTPKDKENAAADTNKENIQDAVKSTTALLKELSSLKPSDKTKVLSDDFDDLTKKMKKIV